MFFFLKDFKINYTKSFIVILVFNSFLIQHFLSTSSPNFSRQKKTQQKSLNKDSLNE